MHTAAWGERSFKHNRIQEGRGATLKEKEPSEWVWYFCFWSRYLWAWPGRAGRQNSRPGGTDEESAREWGLQWESSSVSQLWENRCLNLHRVDVVVHAYTPSTQEGVTDLDVQTGVYKDLVIHIYEYSYTWVIYVCEIYINYISTTSLQHGFDNWTQPKQSQLLCTFTPATSYRCSLIPTGLESCLYPTTSWHMLCGPTCYGHSSQAGRG